MIETRDRALLERALRASPVWGGYALADLDEPLFARTRWFLSDPAASAILLFYVPGPTVIALGAPEPAAALFAAVARGELLPATFHLHYPAALEVALEPLVRGGRRERHVRLGLTRERWRPRSDPEPLEWERLGPEHAASARAFYDANYPGHWFDPARLTEGHYLAARLDGERVALGGTHALAPGRRVAAIGDLVVDARRRGRGLGTALTNRLCADLLEQVDLVVLNVAGSNTAGLRAYERVGFGAPVDYVEALDVAAR